MAITKERLQELINEGATIYYKGGYSIDLSKTDSFMENIFEFYYMIEDNRLLKMQKQPHIALNQWWIKDLYETQKQSEWHLKYHATRTEELDLPMWEEIEDTYVLEFGNSFLEVCKTNNKIFVGTDKNYLDLYKYVFSEPATEENYEKACDLCLKLFKGEESDE